MKHLNPTQIKLIELLTQTQGVSGNCLGQALGMSRTAIWKHIQRLIEAGVPITSVPRQGYVIDPPIIQLTAQRMHDAFNMQQTTLSPQLHLFSHIDSTNQFLKQLPPAPPVKQSLTTGDTFTLLDLCCAETQTEGRGRFGRHWHSPFGENLYCSSRWQFHGDLSLLSGLSLVVSLAIVSLLTDLNLTDGVGIKWPNDILWHEKKLCGSLIELAAESHGSVHLVIGIGLNVNSDTHQHPLPDRAWCSLREMAGTYFDRNVLVAQLILKLQRYLKRFATEGMSAFMTEWEQWDCLRNKSITVSHPCGHLTGIAQGINTRGQLLLVDEKQKIHALISGETSIPIVPGVTGS